MRHLKKLLFISGALAVPFVAGAQNAVGFDDPLKAKTICSALKAFLDILMTFAVPVAVVFLVYSGFLFVWARGNPKGLAKAKTNLLYVIIGIALFMGAWLLGQVVANTLNTLATGAGQQNTLIGECR